MGSFQGSLGRAWKAHRCSIHACPVESRRSGPARVLAQQQSPDSLC
ncbi:hypothetical protein PFWH6_3144 [Pseudomonas fluorescens WH6]|nr:hypothetical protein PFWH6_3144 [Pseudomonas fluorescens WH6]